MLYEKSDLTINDMATTVKAVVRKGYVKKDGTHNVKIRITHNRETKFIPTTVYVYKSDLRKDLSIKNAVIEDRVNDLVKEVRGVLNNLSFQIPYMSMDEIVSHITKELAGQNNEEEVQAGFKLDICKWMNSYADGITEGTGNLYRSTVIAMQKYDSRVIDVNSITYKWLDGFARFVNGGDYDKSAKRIVYIYTTCLKASLSRLKLIYNDEDSGVINITLSPFTKFKLPRQAKTEYKSITAEELRKLIRLELDEKRAYYRDVFILSFLLAGMNPVDLYTCTTIEDNRIVYNRSKTKSRRTDKALIHIYICDHAKEIMERMRDDTNKRLFSFYKRYSSVKKFRERMTEMIKKIGEEIGIENLTMYSARHTWATIALNDVKLDKYLVHDAMNHADPSMKITDIYIRKDWRRIDEAILKVEKYIYSKKATTK